jgi:hypothetical protein
MNFHNVLTQTSVGSVAAITKESNFGPIWVLIQKLKGFSGLIPLS